MLRVAGLAILAVSLAAGQVLFKQVGRAIRGHGLTDGLLALARQPALYAALVLYTFATMLWIWILSRVPLSQAYPWVASTVAIVPILGWWVFGEQVKPLFWVGIALIFAGVIITQSATGSR